MEKNRPEKSVIAFYMIHMFLLDWYGKRCFMTGAFQITCTVNKA